MDQQGNVNLNYTTPIVTSDGNVVLVSDQGVPTLLFFQVRTRAGNDVNADVVSAVRFSSLDDLKNLQKAIADTIKQHNSREH